MMAAATAAAATAAATFVGEFVFVGDAAEFKRLADELADFLLHVMHLLLGFDKSLGDGIGQKGVAQLLETGDFGLSQ